MDSRQNFKTLQDVIAEEFRDKEKVKKASEIGKMTVESSISLANVYVRISVCIFLDMFACVYVCLCLCVY